MVSLNKFTGPRGFRDGETRLVIPNLKIIGTDAITNIASSFVTNPKRTRRGSWFGDGFSNSGESVLTKAAHGISDTVMGLIDILTVGLGVTKIETSQEYTMPFSKGIGSTGEVIHLLGARNEMINLQFTTDRYPGRMGYVLRGILQKTLEMAQVVYLVDDLFLATPCLFKKIRISKTANYRGAVMGEIELVSLTTGSKYANFDTIKKLKNAAIEAVTFTPFSSANRVIGVAIGTIAIGAGLINGIVNI